MITFKIKKVILQKALVVVIGILFFLMLSVAYHYYSESDTDSPTAEILKK